MTGCSLFIDCDGTSRATQVLVLGEDGSCLGQLKSVMAIDYRLSMKKVPVVKLTVAKVPGRFLANEVLLKTVNLSRWRRLRRLWNLRWRLPWIAS
jgi:hypothetical protein